jgi:hypothetical protein
MEQATIKVKEQREKTQLKGLGFALFLVCFNLSPLFFQKFIGFAPLFYWRKGPLSYEKPSYPPAGTEVFAFWIMVLFIDLYIICAFCFKKYGVNFKDLKHRWLLPALNIGFFCLFFITMEMGINFYVRTHLLTPFRPSAELFWTMQPGLKNFYNATGNYHINTDSHGFRGSREISTGKAASTFRIITLGDSGPFGHGLEEEQSYQVQLEKLLSLKYPGKRIEVVNACVPGWTTQEARIFLQREGFAFKPDLVILGFNNDSSFDYVEEKQRLVTNPIVAGMRRIFYRSELYLLLKNLFLNSKIFLASAGSEVKAEPDLQKPLVRRGSLQDFINNIRIVMALTQEHNCRLILVNNPIDLATYLKIDPGQPFNSVRIGSIDFSYRDALKKFAGENRLPLLNAHDIWAERKYQDFFLHGDYIHPNARGQRWLAEQLASIIEAGAFLSKPQFGN